MTSKGFVLFGVKTPIIVEFEETLERCGISLMAGVSLGGPVRMLDRKKLVSIDNLPPDIRDAPFLPCAFSPAARSQLYRRALELGFVLSNALTDPNAIIARSSKIGAGSYVNAAAVIGAASRIGDLVLINRSASIGHHCIIGKHASIGPGAVLASNVRVGDSAVIGAGAVILPDVRIGDSAVVAGGSVVRRDVPEKTVVAGNPARPMRLSPDRTSVTRSDQE